MSSCRLFPNYEVMREIPFAASAPLHAYHKLVVEEFVATLPLHKAVHNAWNAERTKGRTDTSYEKGVKPHQARLERATARFKTGLDALWAKIPEDEQERYEAAQHSVWARADNGVDPKEHASPSGRYRLVVTTYPTRPGCWTYSRGKVYVGDTLIADVTRNYHGFEFAWVEGHPRGDFLLCGADYQGQTVIELPSGKRHDYLPPEAKQGAGFCWVGAEPSPDFKYLAVEGCLWACPYETRLYNFSDPMALPYKDVTPEDGIYDDFCWNPDGTYTRVKKWTTRKSDGKPEDDLTEEERDALVAAERAGIPRDELWENREAIITERCIVGAHAANEPTKVVVAQENPDA